MRNWRRMSRGRTSRRMRDGQDALALPAVGTTQWPPTSLERAGAKMREAAFLVMLRA